MVESYDCKVATIQSWFGEIIIKYKYDGRNMFIESANLKLPPTEAQVKRIMMHCETILKELRNR